MQRRLGQRARLIVLMALAMMAQAGSLRAQTACRAVVFTGEVAAGANWQKSIGNGWQLRLLPVEPGKAGYSGWDLVVETDPASGYPDALLLASPPFNSIHPREIATTYGLRAQDALGWNPRPFRFLASREALNEARTQYAALQKEVASAGATSAAASRAMARLLELQQKAPAGELRILDAHLSPGTADAAPFTENWALAYPRTPHTVAPPVGGVATPRGQLQWMKFSVTLWLPVGWSLPQGVAFKPVNCR